MNASSCVFTSLETMRQNVVRSVYGSGMTEAAPAIAVDVSQPDVDVVTFYEAPTDETRDPASPAPDMALRADFSYGSEAMDYLEVTLSAENAPIGSEIALTPTNPNTVPPMAIA